MSSAARLQYGGYPVLGRILFICIWDFFFTGFFFFLNNKKYIYFLALNGGLILDPNNQDLQQFTDVHFKSNVNEMLF